MFEDMRQPTVVDGLCLETDRERVVIAGQDNDVMVGDRLAHATDRAALRGGSEDLPRAAALFPEIISLPLYPGMTEGQVDYVCESIRQVIAAYLR